MDGCIFLGSQSFPDTDFTHHQAFLAAKTAFAGYVASTSGLSIPAEACLDLFNSPISSLEQLEKVVEYVRTLKSAKSGQLTELIIYYVGHGLLSKRNDDLLWAVRASKTTTGDVSCLSVGALADAILNETKDLRLYFIVDCCFSGAAAKLFMSGRPIENVLEKVNSTVGPSSGIAFLCSSSSDEISFVLDDRSSTVFTSSLVNVLVHGHGLDPEEDFVSLQRLHAVCSSQIMVKFGKTRPVPFLVDPKQDGALVSTVKKFRAPTKLGKKPGKEPPERNEFIPSPEEEVLAHKLETAAMANVASFLETIRHLEQVREAYALNWRSKAASDILAKVKRKVEQEGKADYSVSRVTDVVGLRVACLFQFELLEVITAVAELVCGKSAINPNHLSANEILEVIVYTTDGSDLIGSMSSKIKKRLEVVFNDVRHSPKIEVKYAQSYSSVHIVITRVFQGRGTPLRLPIEIQLRTIFEDVWAQADHKLRYAAQRVKQSPAPNSTVAHERHLVTLKKLLDVASEYSETILDEVKLKERPSSQTIVPIDGRDEFRAMAIDLGIPTNVTDTIAGLLVRKDEVDTWLRGFLGS